MEKDLTPRAFVQKYFKDFKFDDYVVLSNCPNHEFNKLYHMPLYDKSSPADIMTTFAISKGQFKKALGGLMKQKKIKQDETGTTLL